MKHVTRVAVLVTGLLLVSSIGFGKTKEELQAELIANEQQMQAIQRKAFESPELRAQIEQSRKEEEAFRKTISEIPEIKVIDEKLKALQKEMSDLSKQRMEILQKQVNQSADLKKKMDAGTDVFKVARENNPELKALEKARQEILKQLKENAK
jgi:hypothetical protein